MIGAVLGTGAWRYVRIIVLIFTGTAVLRLIPLPRRTSRRSVALAVATVVVVAAGAGGLAVELASRPHRYHPDPVADGTAAARTIRPGVGVFVAGATASYRPVAAFAKLTGARPGLVTYFSGWDDPFQSRFAGWARAQHALPFVQMEPGNVSLASIASGRSDAYLRRFAAATRAFRFPVAVSFAPEANGPFYSWGCRHTPAPVYIAAWRHVHAVMAAAGARNIIWTWDMNRVYRATCPLAARWPGAAYVDWIGVDGYWRGAGDTFASVLAPTIHAALRLARKPVLIGETGVADVPQAAAWVRSLFHGARHTGSVIGIVWFNYHDRLGDYRLQDDPAALAQFRREIRTYR
jgi:hypothetical protein